MLTVNDIQFITEHAQSDTIKLLLGAANYPGIQVPICVKCIEARRKLADKIPQWYRNPALVYPVPLSVEQCSSQATALYKKELLKRIIHPLADINSAVPSQQNKLGADLTGGMGVDSYYLSQIVPAFFYFERNSELCRAAEYNFKQLQALNIRVKNKEITPENIGSLANTKFAFVFLDPARRSKTNQSTKVISLPDYEPNLLELKETLFTLSSNMLVKVSPMTDIASNLKWLPETTQVHVISVDNECKEVLFLLQKPAATTPSPSLNTPPSSLKEEYHSPSPQFFAVNIYTKQTKTCSDAKSESDNLQDDTLERAVCTAAENAFTFIWDEEEKAIPEYTSFLYHYLYEPNKSILKCGAFKLIAKRYNLKKLAPNTHLYTSDTLVATFPGKCYRIQETIDFNKRNIKELAKRHPHADITARNFPMDTNALKKLSGIHDGGTCHIFAMTLTNGKRKLIVGDRVQS